eukprot:m.286320 g.286320  ORF g.286320 m.286320 type:complete len:417 (+) comp16350_c0_seq6:553-1803(+)
MKPLVALALASFVSGFLVMLAYDWYPHALSSYNITLTQFVSEDYLPEGPLRDSRSILPGDLFKASASTNEGNVLHVVVTGGAGYIGSHAAVQLLSQGHFVTVLDNLSRGNLEAISKIGRHSNNRFAFFLVDLGVLSDVKHVLMYMAKQRTIDVVIHFAAVAFVAEAYQKPLLYYQNVTMNTMNLLKAMEHVQCTQLIYSSSCATYGNVEHVPVTETTPQNPINPYGTSKKMAEQVIKDYVKSNKGFAAVILRYFNVIGADPELRVGEMPAPDLPASYKRISHACFDVARGFQDSMTISGSSHPTKDGTCVRDYIHVSDLVNAHISAFRAFHEGNVEIFNVGVGRGYSVMEFVQACREVTGVNISIKIGVTRPGDVSEIYSDAKKIRKQLGWVPRYTTLNESLRTSWSWIISRRKSS